MSMYDAKKVTRTIITATAVVTLVGCLPSGGGGGGGGGGPGGDLFEPGGEDPGSTTLTLTPPGTLTLDGQSIVSGEFVVESATAYTFDGGQSDSRQVVTTPVIISAEIGTGNHDLFDVPATTQAVDFNGFFDANNPDLPPARFTVTVFGDFSEPVEMTVFLPENTSEEANQISGATANEAENTNIFTDEEVPPAAYPEVVAASGGPGDIDPEAFPLNVPQTATGFNPHGNIRARPPVDTGPECMVDSDCMGANEVCSDQRCVGEGALRFTLSWDVTSDFDLYVQTPDGTLISYQNRTGENFTLDRDDTSGGGGSVENVYFTSLVPGQYQYWVQNYDGAQSGPFTIRVFVNQSEVDTLSGSLPAESGAESERRTVTVP